MTKHFVVETRRTHYCNDKDVDGFNKYCINSKLVISGNYLVTYRIPTFIENDVVVDSMDIQIYEMKSRAAAQAFITGAYIGCVNIAHTFVVSTDYTNYAMTVCDGFNKRVIESRMYEVYSINTIEALLADIQDENSVYYTDCADNTILDFINTNAITAYSGYHKGRFVKNDDSTYKWDYDAIFSKI